jgi:hypothetical protein
LCHRPKLDASFIIIVILDPLWLGWGGSCCATSSISSCLLLLLLAITLPFKGNRSQADKGVKIPIEYGHALKL